MDRLEHQGQLLRVSHIVVYSPSKEWGGLSNKALLTDKFPTLFWQQNTLT